MMIFGGAVTLVLAGFFFIFFILWLTIRLFLIYLKWFHRININYRSINFDKIENLTINHRLFHLNIEIIQFFSSFSLINWRLPVITLHHIRLKIHPIQKISTNKIEQNLFWKKKLSYLKYLSIRIERFAIEYENIGSSFQRLTIYSANTPNSINTDMWINGEYVDIWIVDKNTDILLFKSMMTNLEMQTNFDQRLILNTNYWFIELNQKLLDDYFQEKQMNFSSSERLSTCHYIDTNLFPISSPILKTSFLNKFDQYLDYLRDPFLNLSVQHFNFKYISTKTIHVYPTLETAFFSFHNSSKTSSETRHAYIANFRLHSHSTLVIHGLCQLTVYPNRIDVTCQLNEFYIQLHEQIIEQIQSFLPSQSSSSSTNSWIFDRQIDVSFQFLNPSFHLKFNEINQWFLCQLNFFKILFHSNQNIETKSLIEFKNFLIYTSENLNSNQSTYSQMFYNELEKKHFWNCLLFLPNANITILINKTKHIQSEINGMRLQINEIFFQIIQRLQTMRKSSTNSFDFSLYIKSLSIILCDIEPVYLFLTISTIRASRTYVDMKKILAFFDERSSTSIPLNSLTSGQKLVDIRRLNIQNILTNSKLKISISNHINLVWSTKFHLFLYHFKQSFSYKNSNKSDISFFNSIEFNIDTCAHIYLQLANDCRVHFQIHQFSSEFFQQQIQMKFQCSQLIIDWEKQCLFNLHNISFIRLYQSEELTTERILLKNNLETLEMLSNRASFVEIQLFSIQFPFDSSFNSVIEKLVNIRKWLKLLHQNIDHISRDFLHKIPRHIVSNDVWTDLSIKINDFELTIIDDLFEVKLFQNYCLMADEYQEREIREQELQRRIDQFEHHSQPLHNIHELRQALSEANARVYIKRSLQTNYDQNKQRIKRNLIRWHLKQVNLIALADQSWTGKENIMKIIHRIDSESTQMPIEQTDFSTLWCRYVILKCEEWSIHFRDFRQPLWQMKQFHLWGHICAAEITPNSLDSIRTPWVDIGEPYQPNQIQVQRLLSPLKFYHDINSDIDSFVFSYGPAWENTMAQVNLCLNGITPRAKDPSPLLPWWDKTRLYLHGRWSFAAKKMSWLYHVASNPYNDTEEMEWVWDQAFLDWTNGKFIIQALSLSIKLRTSSKYDDCCLLSLPNVDTRITLNWLCQSNPNDHHSVRLYTREAVDSWPNSRSHDSYAHYRSYHLKLSAKFECKDIPQGSTSPTCTIYASTLRFCERVKNTMMSITRPTRRGRLFLPSGETIVPPRKPLLSRHYESIELQLILPQFRVKYLTSFARQTGAQVDCQLFNFITYQELNLIDYHDGLSRRPRILWKPKMMNINLKRAQMWLLRDANEDKELNEINQQESQQEQTFFLSLNSLSYIRSSSISSQSSTHSVLIDELKAVWNLINRRTIFLIYERYRKNNILRSNLSNPFAKELGHLEQEKNFNTSSSDQSPSDENINNKTTIINDDSISVNMNGPTTTTTTTTTQHSTLASFLDQLINESQHKPSVDLDPTVDASVSLIGLRQCTKDDVEEHTLRIELTDSQIALRGIETSSYVILSAAVGLVDQYRHKPVWRDEQLCDKTSWHGNLQGMQYFATTIRSSTSTKIDNSPIQTLSDEQNHEEIIWIPRRDIRDENSLLGESSRSVIGSIATNNGCCDQQLQCIISKSNATLSYVFYTEQTQEETSETNIVIPPFVKPTMNESNPIGENDRLLVDSFTFIHNDIQLSTNSSQYRTIMDIVNNLLLYVEPKEEGTNNKLRKLRLQIQLANNLPVLRESIRHLLERVRATSAELRRLEREIYYYSRASHILVHSYSSEDEDGITRERTFSFTSYEYEQLQKAYTSVKIELNKLAEKLGMMCAVYKDMQLARIVKLRIASTSNKLARLERRYELHGGSITWFIKHDDGQIKNAQFLLRNILYTKRYFENGTNEHSISIGQAQVDNLLPDDRYQTILTSNCQQQQTMIRVYCKEGESVGGIAVKEHLEINVAPLVIQMTRRFSQMLMTFLFPTKTQLNSDIQSSNKSSTKRSTLISDQRRTRSAEAMFRRFSRRISTDIRWGDEELLPGRSLFYFSIHDLDAMENRAKNTLTFQYIKIPEVSLIVSYKIRGTKEKKIGDLENAHISFPTLEYRNLTCSWHDLVLAIKSDVKNVLLSQAIRQNINLRLPFIGKSTRAQNQQLLATTTTTTTMTTANRGEGTNSHLYNSDMMTNHEMTNTSEQEEEEQKHKMKLVLGTKISKDLITQFKRRKDT